MKQNGAAVRMNDDKFYLEIFPNQERKKNKLLSWKVYISVHDK